MDADSCSVAIEAPLMGLFHFVRSSHFIDGSLIGALPSCALLFAIMFLDARRKRTRRGARSRAEANLRRCAQSRMPARVGDLVKRFATYTLLTLLHLRRALPRDPADIMNRETVGRSTSSAAPRVPGCLRVRPSHEILGRSTAIVSPRVAGCLRVRPSHCLTSRAEGGESVCSSLDAGGGESLSSSPDGPMSDGKSADDFSMSCTLGGGGESLSSSPGVCHALKTCSGAVRATDDIGSVRYAENHGCLPQGARGRTLSNATPAADKLIYSDCFHDEVTKRVLSATHSHLHGVVGDNSSLDEEALGREQASQGPKIFHGDACFSRGRVDVAKGAIPICGELSRLDTRLRRAVGDTPGQSGGLQRKGHALKCKSVGLFRRWTERFRWAQRILNALRPAALAPSGRPWRLSTLFSGIGGAEHSLAFLTEACPTLRASSVLACERDRQCHKVLRSVLGDVPVLTDVTALLNTTLLNECRSDSPSLDALAKQLREADAEPLPGALSADNGVIAAPDFGDVCISGIPCIDYSLMGKQRHEHGHTLIVIIAWARGLRGTRPPFAIVENVVQFKVDILKLLIGDLYDIDTLHICASAFGWPARRKRLYVILTLRGCVRLRRPLRELPGALGLPWSSAGASELLFGTFPATTPTAAQQRTIRDYMSCGKVRGQDVFYDLTQRPSSGRGRAALGTGPLFTLTAHTSKVWMPRAGRFLHPRELLLAQGFVTFDDLSASIDVPVLPGVEGLGTTTLARMAGNAMHVPTVGAILAWLLAYGELAARPPSDESLTCDPANRSKAEGPLSPSCGRCRSRGVTRCPTCNALPHDHPRHLPRRLRGSEDFCRHRGLAGHAYVDGEWMSWGTFCLLRIAHHRRTTKLLRRGFAAFDAHRFISEDEVPDHAPPASSPCTPRRRTSFSVGQAVQDGSPISSAAALRSERPFPAIPAFPLRDEDISTSSTPARDLLTHASDGREEHRALLPLIECLEEDAPNGERNRTHEHKPRTRDIFPLPMLSPAQLETVERDLCITDVAAFTLWCRLAVAGLNRLAGCGVSAAGSKVNSAQLAVQERLASKVHRALFRLAQVPTRGGRLALAELTKDDEALGRAANPPLVAADCDLLELSGGVNPLPDLDEPIQAVLTDPTKLFERLTDRLKVVLRIRREDLAEYCKLVVRQLKSKKVLLSTVAYCGAGVFSVGKKNGRCRRYGTATIFRKPRRGHPCHRS